MAVYKTAIGSMPFMPLSKGENTLHKLFDLTGKIAVVTCCASDMGQQMAEALAEAGADIVGIDKFSLTDVETAIKRYGRNFTGIKADLSNTTVIPDIIRSIVDNHGRIDILIAYSNEQDNGEEPENISWDEYLHIVDANQNAIVRMATLVYSHMLKQGAGGKIVIVSSALADRTASDTLAYTVTKNAIIGLMRTLSIAGAQYNVWVNAIAPGIIKTSVVDVHLEMLAKVEAELEQAGMGLMKMKTGKPSDIRGAAVFLSSKASDYAVGQILRVDGGFTSRL